MPKVRRKNLLSLSTLLASFFGAAMIAGAFAYFNYKFSEFKFIDFSEFVYYEQDDIFTPTQDRYIVIFYSSKNKDTVQLLANIELAMPILAIDFYNNVQQNNKKTIFLRSGTNTSLKFIQRFNIYETPSIFIIKRSKDNLYKQDSMIRVLDNMNELSKQVKNL